MWVYGRGGGCEEGGGHCLELDGVGMASDLDGIPVMYEGDGIWSLSLSSWKFVAADVIT